MSGLTEDGGTVRLIWPILDESLTLGQLIAEAAPEVPMLISRAHAVAAGVGRFYTAHSWEVPGSGRVSNLVLVFEAPATAAPSRPYWPATPIRQKARPADDVDDSLVTRILEGDWGSARTTTKAERVLITARWTARGGTLAELTRHTGWKTDRYLSPDEDLAAAS